MKFTKEFLAMALAGKARESAELAPVMRKCARAGAAKSNAMVHVDDVEQELWMFLMKNVGRLDEAYNIEPYLIETARNISLSYNRRYAFLGTDSGEAFSNDGISGLNGGEIASAEEALDAIVAEASMTQAMEYLLSRSPRLRAAAAEQLPEEDEMKASSTGKAAKKEPRELSPAQKELREIRASLSYSQHEMAAKIGVKLPTYQAYEYGKTHDVADDVMERARRLLKDTDYSYIQSLYEGKTMDKIASDWAARLNLKPGEVSELARMLGCNKSTVSRWYNDNVKLNAWELVRYESIVAMQEKRLRAARKAGEAHTTH